MVSILRRKQIVGLTLGEQHMPYRNVFCYGCLWFILLKLKSSCVSGFSVNIFILDQILYANNINGMQGNS